MQNKNSSVTAKFDESEQEFTSCVRLSPYKKWMPQDNGRYKFLNYCPVCDMESVPKIANGTRSGVTMSMAAKESILYEPYSMRPPKTNMNIVHCKHFSSHPSTNSEMIHSRILKTESPNKQSSVSEQIKDNNFYTSKHNGSNSESPVKTGYQNGFLQSKTHFLNYSMHPLGGREVISEDFMHSMDEPCRENKSPIKKINAESSIDTFHNCQSTFRKMLDKHPSMIRDVCSPNKIIYKMPHKHYENMNIKCGNASCNGSEPLKETHITNTHSLNLNGVPDSNIENNYQGDVAVLRGKFRELTKKSPQKTVADVRKKEHLSSPVEKKLKERTQLPKKIPIKRHSTTVRHSPKIINIHDTLNDSESAVKKIIESETIRPSDNKIETANLLQSPSIDEISSVVSPPLPVNSYSEQTEKNGETKFINGDLNLQTVKIKAHAKVKKRNKLNSRSKSDSESEISDSECSEPGEVESEEKQINYETVLNELAAIRNDLIVAYNSITLPEVPESGDSAKQTSLLRPSIFPNVPPYIRFASHDKPGPKLPVTIQRQLKWRLSNITPVIVRKTLINSGFRLIRCEGNEESNDWVGVWGKHLKSPCFKQLKDYQKMNHFPGTFQLGRKDRLWRNTQKLQLKFGMKEFDYVPKTYILPQDLKQLRHVWEKNEGVAKWILKPPASARGSGIRVVNRWNQVPKKKPLVVQKYIDNPYLINGSKFDLRLYVLLTSFDPLRIYLYPDGLARFASVKYSSDSSTLDNRYMHLTNYSINKMSRDYTANEDAGACQGHKWTIQALWDYLQKNGVDTVELWASLQDLVIKTIISGESGITQLLRGNVGSRYNCYELFGVDVLLDENLKPWLLEVNISPSLHSTSPLDLFVKGPLVQTLLNMAQYHIPTDTLTPQQRQHIIKSLGLRQSKDEIRKSTSPPPIEIRNKSRSTSDKSKSKELNDSSDDQDGCGDTENIPLCYDPRIYTVNLTQRERLKQHEMVSYETREEYLDSILTNLTPDDVRHLIIAEDELQAAGKFEKIFPTKNTYHYLSLMETRYYDRLFDAWEYKYSSNRILGIGLLQAYCVRKYHLIVPNTPKIIKENVSTTESKVKGNLEENTGQTVAVQSIDQTPTASTDGTTMEGPSPSRKPRIRAVRRRYGRSVGVLTIKHYPCKQFTYHRRRIRRRSRSTKFSRPVLPALADS